MMHPLVHASNQSLPGGQANMAPDSDAQVDVGYLGHRVGHSVEGEMEVVTARG